MKSKVDKIEENKTFPCLMEYWIMGEDYVGTYLVTQKKSGKFWVARVAGNNLDEMYMKDDLNLSEWKFLPKGTKVIIEN